jgi:hypothetical protein
MLMSQFSQCGYRLWPLDYLDSIIGSSSDQKVFQNSARKFTQETTRHEAKVGGAVVSSTKKQFKDSNASRTSTHFEQRLVISKKGRSYPVVLKGQSSSSSSIPKQQRPHDLSCR